MVGGSHGRDLTDSHGANTTSVHLLILPKIIHDGLTAYRLRKDRGEVGNRASSSEQQRVVFHQIPTSNETANRDTRSLRLSRDRVSLRVVSLNNNFMSNQISIAVIGAGKNSRMTHLPILGELRDRGTFHLSIICDINDSLAESVRAEFGFNECTTNAEAIFDRDEVDAVYVIGTTQMHFEYAKKALLSGKHVFIEKPPTPRADDALELMRIVGTPLPPLLSRIGWEETPLPAVLLLTRKPRSGSCKKGVPSSPLIPSFT